MFINKLTLHNFRCFEDVEIEFEEGLTVIVGNNGAGKTAILEGGVIAASSFFLGLDGVFSGSISQDDVLLKSYSLGSNDDVQKQYPTYVTAEGDITDGKEWKRSLNGNGGKTTIVDASVMKKKSRMFQDKLRKGDESLILPIIAYYGTGRLWDNHRARRVTSKDQNIKSTRTNGYIDCIDGTANLKLMNEWFKKQTIRKYQYQELGKGKVYELEAVYNAMERCFSEVTGYTDVKIQYSLDTFELFVNYTNKNKVTRIPLSLLSAGYKGTISLIADIAYRMATLNPHLKENVLTETTGIIFIDEIDLHLHPTWQQRILSDLTTIFPKVQFIVSTHAPAVINTTRSNNLRILSDYQITEVSQQVYGNDVNSILNNIMDADERPLDISNLFKDFYDKLDKCLFDEAERILDKIDDLRETSDKEVSGCRVKLKLERIRKGVNG